MTRIIALSLTKNIFVSKDLTNHEKIFLSLLLCSSLGAFAQGYIPPKEPEVQQKLKQWQDKNSALLFIGDFTAFPELWNPGIFVLKKKIGFPAPKHQL